MDNKKVKALIFLMTCLSSYDNRSIDDIIDHALNYNEETINAILTSQAAS